MNRQAVHKYPLIPGALNALHLPLGFRPVHVAEQHDQLVLWALVDPTVPLQSEQVLVVGTGQELNPGPWRHIGTAVCQSGLVWHVFIQGVEPIGFRG